MLTRTKAYSFISSIGRYCCLWGWAVGQQWSQCLTKIPGHSFKIRAYSFRYSNRVLTGTEAYSFIYCSMGRHSCLWGWSGGQQGSKCLTKHTSGCAARKPMSFMIL